MTVNLKPQPLIHTADCAEKVVNRALGRLWRLICVVVVVLGFVCV